MGWNLLRRYFLIAPLACLGFSSLWSQNEHLPIIRLGVSFNQDRESRSLTPLKDLRSELHFQYPFQMNETIEEFVEYYSAEEKLSYLQRSLDRAEPFRHHIMSTIEEKNLPRELFYLALTESAFRVHAVSRSGAVGLWQFMMNSIDPYDITVDDWRDDRRDFWRSTEGALEKLKYNYDKTGSWDLALASYNCGLNGMRRIIARTGEDDYWSLAGDGHLPYETKRYLPKFLAISIICSYGGRYGLDRKWDDPMVWERLELDRSVDLKLLAEESGIDYQLLSLGNAELNFQVTPPVNSGYALKIPEENADSVNRILNESDSAFMGFYRYNIKSGDTLSEISEHYRVPLAMIYRYNDNLSPRFLRPGQTVIIPSLVDVPPFRENEDRPVPFDGTYIVQKGDSLWSISGKFNISPELLALGNKLPVNGILNIGMKLSVPSPE